MLDPAGRTLLALGLALVLPNSTAAGLLGAARAADCAGPGEALKTGSVIRGVIGNLKEKGERTIRTESEWKELWGKLGLPLNPPVPAPAIDFSKNMVFAVSAGEGRGIVEVEIIKVERKAGCILVTVAERLVPPKMSAVQFTSFHPFHFVRVGTTPGTVVFRYVKR